MRLRICVLFGFFLLSQPLFSQSDTKFWFAAPAIGGTYNSPIYLRISSFSQSSTVTVSQPANPSFAPIVVTVPANGTQTVDLTSRLSMVETGPPNTILNTGLLIDATNPVTVYYDEMHALNPEIFALKGSNALGLDFYIPTPNVYKNGAYTPTPYNSFDIVATENSTLVTITPSKAIVGHPANVPFSITLNRGQTYSARATSQLAVNHLYGSKVVADKPVAITMKDDLLELDICRDLIGDQIVPVTILGTQYIVVRGFLNPNDYFFVIATQDNTNIYIDGSGTPITTLNKGGIYSYQFLNTEACKLVTTNNPVYVLHASGSGCELGGALLPSTDCTGSTQVAFTRTTTFNFGLIITTKNGAQDAFLMDGSAGLITPAQFASVPGDPTRVYARITLTSAQLGVGGHILSNTEENFGMGILFETTAANGGGSYGYFSGFALLNLGPDQTWCQGQSTVLDAGPGRTSYLWTTGETTQTITVTTSGTYGVTVVDHGCTLSDNVVVTFKPLPTLTNDPLSKQICSGSSTNITLTSSISGSTYTWTATGSSGAVSGYSNGSGSIINQILTVTGTLDQTVTYHIIPTANGCSGAETDYVVTVTPNLTVSVSISANPSGAICQGTSVTFTALPTNGGSTPSYQWTLNGSPISGATSSTYTSSTLANGNQIRCVMTSSASCVSGNPATSTPITMTVNPNLTVGVSISANPSGAICQGTSVTFTATPTNGGSSPSYQWILNGNPISGATSSTYTSSSLVNGDQIRCILTSNVTCPVGNPATSAPITMTVNPNLPVSISISANPSGAICQGTSVTFTAVPTNGGTSPAYQWSLNGTPVPGATSGSYTTTTLANADQVRCILTSNATCISGNPATSDPITMTVNPLLPVSVDISANPTGAICDGTSVIFTATPTNGGTTPAYQWSLNGTPIPGATSSTYTTSTLANADQIRCIVTSNATCATGNPATSAPITMTVNPNLTVGVSISANPSGAICQGTSVTFTATPTNGGSSPFYQWTLNGNPISGATSSTYNTSSLIDGDQIRCVLTSNATCAIGNPTTSAPITMTVNPNLPVSVTISANPTGPICDGTSVTFTGVPANGGTSPAYQWSLNGTPVPGATSGSYTTTTLANGDQVRCILTSNATCVSGNPATSDPITMTVNPLLPVSVAISANPTGAICDGTSVTFTAIPANGGTTPAYQWTLNGTPIPGETSGTYTTSTLANADQIRCIVTSNATCATGNPATSAPITMTVNPNLPVSVTISANPPGATCDGTSVTYTAVPVNGGSSPAYQWSLNGTQIPGEISGTYTSSALTDGNQVQCAVTSNATCAVGNPANSNIIIVQRLPLPTVSLTLCIPVTARDAQSFTLKQGLPLGGSFSGTAVQGNKFNPALVPAGQSTSTVTYSYTNVNNCTNSASQTVAVFPANPGFICGQPLTDVRDNQIYTTKQIGTQCWMSENLNYGTFISSSTYQYDNCVAEKFCYSDFASSCTLYGGLYQWDELMQYETTLGVQGFCPPGWHIPTGSDWNLLFSNLQGQGNAGDSLKTTGTTGFNATLSGVRYFNQSWNFGNQTATFYWSSVQSSAIRTIAHGINIQNNSVSDYASSRANAFAVRCLKD